MLRPILQITYRGQILYVVRGEVISGKAFDTWQEAAYYRFLLEEQDEEDERLEQERQSALLRRAKGL